MRAWRLVYPAPASRRPLRLDEAPIPDAGPGRVLVRVRACGVCRTDLHVIEGELPVRRSLITPGHQVVGDVTAVGPGVATDLVGRRVGVAWLHSTCGTCRFCTSDRENLCEDAQFTGWTVDGGFAEYLTAAADFVYPIPSGFEDAQAAPLLCAGIIGYRALRLTGLSGDDGIVTGGRATRGRLSGEEATGGQRRELRPNARNLASIEPSPSTRDDSRWVGARLGLYGFGAAGHVAIQLARARGAEVYVCTRDRERHQALADELGAAWVGGAADSPPVKLDAAIIFAPAGELVPSALDALDKGGVLVLGGIHMSPIPTMPYASLYGERCMRTVTNNTRADGHAFLAEAARVPVRTHVRTFEFEKTDDALIALKEDAVRGAAVIRVTGDR